MTAKVVKSVTLAILQCVIHMLTSFELQCVTGNMHLLTSEMMLIMAANSHE